MSSIASIRNRKQNPIERAYTTVFCCIFVVGAASAVISGFPEYRHGVDTFKTFAPELSSATNKYSKLSEADKSALSKFKFSDLFSKDYSVVDQAYAKVDTAMSDLFGTKSGFYSLFVLDRAKKAFEFGKYDASEKLIKQGMDSFPANTPLALKQETTEHLAYLVSQRDPKEAIKYQLQSLALAKQMADGDSKDTGEYLNRMRSLAFAHFKQGEYKEALPIYRQREAAVKESDGAYSFEYGESLADLGRDELALKDYANAEKHLVAALELQNKPALHNRSRTVPERWSIITTQNCLAQTYVAEKKLAPAIKCEETVLEMCVCDGHPRAFNTVHLSRILRSENKNYQARKILTDDLVSENAACTELELAELAVIAKLEHKQKDADDYMKKWRAKISADHQTSVAENDFKALSSEKLAADVAKNGLTPLENVGSFDDLEPHVTLTVSQFQNLIDGLKIAKAN